MASESETVTMAEPASPRGEPARPADGDSTYPLFRQSSIYSLTLDEFQHAVCEPGKNFGSMNMDEFLNNIWTAEENANAAAAGEAESGRRRDPEGEAEGRIARQPSLPRQGSLSIPAPLCRKTVEEVWSEIHRGQQGERRGSNGSLPNGEIPSSAHRQPTFGEMTLEDFLIKAGVVREERGPSSSAQPAFAEPEFGSGMNLGFADHHRASAAGAGYSGYVPGPPQQQSGASGVMVGDGNYGKRNGGGFSGCYGGRPSGNGFGGPVGSPVSPLSDVGQADMGGIRGGRKRIFDGPIEKVVERRQRRMIKNRESAARSRARKQAYTVELEAELNHLKEENAQLRKEMEELVERRRRRMEAMIRAQENARESEQSKKTLRRVKSWPV